MMCLEPQHDSTTDQDIVMMQTAAVQSDHAADRAVEKILGYKVAHFSAKTQQREAGFKVQTTAIFNGGFVGPVVARQSTSKRHPR